MSFIANLLPYSYILIGILVFVGGFYLVYKNLKKINIVEGEKFNLSDWVAMVGFGSLFGVAIVFMVNIFYELLKLDFVIISVAGFLLAIMIIILILYPLWEIIFLGKPTSDSVHDFHKFLESKILDKFRGKALNFLHRPGSW